MISFDECGEIICTNKLCNNNDNGFCYIGANQLDMCEYPQEFINVRIRENRDYLENISKYISEEFIDEEMSRAKANLNMWLKLADEYEMTYKKL